MNRIREAFRVVGLILLLLVLGMLFQPGPQPRSAYQKATDNLTVPSARAEECTFNQLRCVATSQSTSHCITGGDPNEGCVPAGPNGCMGCIE